MTILGPDQRGLVRAIAAAVEQHQGNWVESRLARLAGQFAGVIRCECSAAEVDALKSDLENLESQGIRINIIQEAISETKPLQTVCVEVIGNDRPGIVRQLSDAIARSGGNVEELVTDVQSAPMSGALLFRARGIISVTTQDAIASLRSEIESLSDDLHVEIHD